jgi:hypothetical protein
MVGDKIISYVACVASNVGWGVFWAPPDSADKLSNENGKRLGAYSATLLAKIPSVPRYAVVSHSPFNFTLYSSKALTASASLVAAVIAEPTRCSPLRKSSVSHLIWVFSAVGSRFWLAEAQS